MFKTRLIKETGCYTLHTQTPVVDRMLGTAKQHGKQWKLTTTGLSPEELTISEVEQIIDFLNKKNGAA